MDDDAGFIALYRKFRKNSLWKERRVFSRAEAWIDLLMSARWKHEPDEVIIGRQVLLCNRGECLKSLDTWGSRWKWSKAKVKRFLDVIRKGNMIDVRNETVTTRIIIRNYDKYQDLRNADETEVKRKGNGDDTQKNHITREPYNQKDNSLSSCVSEETNPTPKENIPYKTIIEYLNQTTGSSFKPSTETYRKHIKARWNQGYRQEDFKKVVDMKFKEWGSDERMVKFLRPETLFGTKMPTYIGAASRSHRSEFAYLDEDMP